MTQASVDVGFRSERGPILISLMLCVALVAIDATVIATAVPSVVADLGGFTQFPWLFSIYLLAQAVTVPIYGKLADLYGRKPVMMLGIGLFLLGSICCGLAWSMPALIVFRALQGLGAGAIHPMSLTIAGDIYTLEERGKVQGYMASVWATSAVLGPTLGGVFAEYLTWRWIFFINIPLCVLAAWMLLRNLHEQIERKRHRLDYLGAVLLTCGATLLILGLLQGGEGWPWLSLAGIGIPAAGLLLILVFVLVERRVEEPVLPLWVFKRRLLLTTTLISLGIGAILIGLTSYVPTFVQGALGSGPLLAGFALATLTLGWPISASQSAKVYMRIGFRSTALIGSAIAIVSTGLMTSLGTSSSIYTVAAFCFLIGLGMGLVASPTLIAAQATVGWSERGVVTGNNMFSRSMGSAIGVAIFGAIANATLPSNVDVHPAADIATASHHVFIAVAAVTVSMTVAVVFMPAVRASDEFKPAG